MQRYQFLTVMAALAATPLLSTAQGKPNRKRAGKGFVTRGGEGRKHGPLRLKGVNENILEVKISGADTDGDFALFEQTSLSPKRGTPLHVHRGQDEVFHVKEGAYRFQVGDEQFDLKAGDTIFLPRRVPHAWSQLSDRGKMLVLMQPAGKLEEFFVALAGRKQPPTETELKKLFSDHEMDVVGPPLTIADR